MAFGKRFRYKKKAAGKKRKVTVGLKKGNIVPTKLRTAIKKVVRSTIEPRQNTLLTGNSISNVIHRDMYYCTPLNNILLGTADGNRVASQIWLKGFRLKMMINRKSTFYDDIRLRVLAFYAPENESDWSEVVSTTWVGATAPMKDDIFQTEGNGLETVNSEVLGLRPIYDKNFILKSNNYGSVTSAVTKTAKPLDIFIPVMKNIRFRSQGTTTQPHRNIFLAFYAYGGGLISSDLNQLFDLSSLYTTYYRDV